MMHDRLIAEYGFMLSFGQQIGPSERKATYTMLHLLGNRYETDIRCPLLELSVMCHSSVHFINHVAAAHYKISISIMACQVNLAMQKPRVSCDCPFHTSHRTLQNDLWFLHSTDQHLEMES